MCLIIFDWRPQHERWLSLSANRDEFRNRPAAALQPWADAPHIAAGRDLSQGGTWLGFSSRGRFAALTNVRAPGVGPAEPRSRGHLATAWLNSDQSAADFASDLRHNSGLYAPFNLLIGTPQQLLHISNHPQIEVTEVTPGIHGLSNAGLDTPWPKTRLGCEQLQASGQPAAQQLAQMLNRREPFADAQLPATGVPLEWERRLSAQFILMPDYGTRCSTGIVACGREVDLHEISWDEQGNHAGQQSLRLLLTE